MKTFNFKAVYSQLLTPEIVFRLTQLHEYKGRLNRLLETDAAALSEIKETAALQTVASSNRMEGITVAEDRLKKLILNKTNPQTDDEKKVAGYRDVLTSISANYDFFVNFQRCGCILAFQLGSYMKASFFGEYRFERLHLGYKL